METKEKSKNTKILARIAENLLRAQQELDELIVQLALGKAEAADKFEEVKKEFASQVADFKKDAKKIYGQELSEETKKKIEQLEWQLAKGKATSKEIFEEQRKKILEAIREIEQDLREWIKRSDVPHYFDHEIEKFKLKAEILWLKFGLKKFEIKEDVRNKILEAKKEVAEVAENVKESIDYGVEKMDEWKSAVAKAYHKFRDAIKD
jgi:hypothetical protein